MSPARRRTRRAPGSQRSSGRAAAVPAPGFPCAMLLVTRPKEGSQAWPAKFLGWRRVYRLRGPAGRGAGRRPDRGVPPRRRAGGALATVQQRGEQGVCLRGDGWVLTGGAVRRQFPCAAASSQQTWPFGRTSAPKQPLDFKPFAAIFRKAGLAREFLSRPERGIRAPKTWSGARICAPGENSRRPR